MIPAMNDHPHNQLLPAPEKGERPIPDSVVASRRKQFTEGFGWKPDVLYMVSTKADWKEGDVEHWPPVIPGFGSLSGAVKACAGSPAAKSLLEVPVKYQDVHPTPETASSRQKGMNWFLDVKPGSSSEASLALLGGGEKGWPDTSSREIHDVEALTSMMNEFGSRIGRFAKVVFDSEIGSPQFCRLVSVNVEDGSLQWESAESLDFTFSRRWTFVDTCTIEWLEGRDLLKALSEALIQPNKAAHQERGRRKDLSEAFKTLTPDQSKELESLIFADRFDQSAYDEFCKRVGSSICECPHCERRRHKAKGRASRDTFSPEDLATIKERFSQLRTPFMFDGIGSFLDRVFGPDDDLDDEGDDEAPDYAYMEVIDEHYHTTGGAKGSEPRFQFEIACFDKDGKSLASMPSPSQEVATDYLKRHLQVPSGDRVAAAVIRTDNESETRTLVAYRGLNAVIAKVNKSCACAG